MVYRSAVILSNHTDYPKKKDRNNKHNYGKLLEKKKSKTQSETEK